MPEHTELWTNDDSPIPILRRAPVLSGSHEESIRAIKETLAFVENLPRQTGARGENVNGTHNDNLRRSISQRISRVATTTGLGRNLSESLRRPRSASQGCAQGGGPSYVRIRKMHGRDNSPRPVSACRRPAVDARVSLEEAVVEVASANDGHGHLARVHDPAMQTETVDQQNGNGNLKSPILEIPVPALLQQGVPMTKVSAKSQKRYIFKLDADQGQIIWESKKLRISSYTCILLAVAYGLTFTLLPPTALNSSHREHQRAQVGIRREILPPAVPARARIRGSMDHHHLHARWTVQDPSPDRFFVGGISTLGHHAAKAVRDKTGTHDGPWKRGDPTRGLDKAMLEVGRRRERPKIDFRAGRKVV